MSTIVRPLQCALLAACSTLWPLGHAVAGDTLSLGSRAGEQHSYAASTWSSMSADGRYVTLGAAQQYVSRIFLYDRFSGATTNLTPDADATAAEISADGRYVTFRSSAGNLGPIDGNGLPDIYRLDRNTGVFQLVSQSSGGAIGNDQSHYAQVSDDGRFVAFTSSASNLVTGDTNGYADAFLRDLKTGRTTRVNVSSSGAQGAWGVSAVSTTIDISGNGRYVVFASLDNTLTGDADTSSVDIFLRDTVTNTTSMISRHVRTGGATVSSDAKYPSISNDGRYIAFQSGSSQLMANDTDDFNTDIFVYDRVADVMTKITAGANGHSMQPRISRDGRFVAYVSQAGNLVANDTNGTWDTFLYDRTTKVTTRVSLNATGGQSAGDGYVYGSRPTLSGDGRFVAFESGAKDLTPDDTDSAMYDVFLRDTLLDKKARANVGITVSAPASAQKGVAYNYSIQVSNAGAGIAKKTNAIVTLPSSLKVVAATSSQGLCTTGGITICRLGSIAVGGTAILSVRVKPLTTGKATLTATAEAVAQDANKGNNRVQKTVSVSN